MQTGGRRRALLLGVFVQCAATVMTQYTTFLIPYLVYEGGAALTDAGVAAMAPMLGAVVGLILWGGVVDRIGETLPVAVGMVSGAVLTLCAATADSLPAFAALMFAAGFGAASGNVASSRMVVLSFDDHERGTAIGVRQMAQPLAFTIAAVCAPGLAFGAGLTAAMLVPSGLCLLAVAAVAATGSAEIPGQPVPPPVSSPLSPPPLSPPVPLPVPPSDPLPDPLPDPVPERLPEPRRAAANPYRTDPWIVRIHVSAMCLVVPQMSVLAISMVWLVSVVGVSTTAASWIVAASQALGGAARIAVGMWSDRLGNRTTVLRVSALAAALAAVLLVALSWTTWAVVVFCAACVVFLGANSLALVAATERGPVTWTGRIASIHTAAQMITAAAMPPFASAVVTHLGYRALFALAGAASLLSYASLISRRRDRDRLPGATR